MCQRRSKTIISLPWLKVMLHRTIRNDDFSATQPYNNVATLFRTVAALFQYCNSVLRSKSSLRIVSCNISFTVLSVYACVTSKDRV